MGTSAPCCLNRNGMAKYVVSVDQSGKVSHTINPELAQELINHEKSHSQALSPGGRTDLYTEEMSPRDTRGTAPVAVQGNSAFPTSTTTATAEEQASQKEKKEQQKDIVTGQILSENGRSCLRCVDHSLRCTLLFAGREGAVQCAACRRAGAVRCVRQALDDVSLINTAIRRQQEQEEEEKKKEKNQNQNQRSGPGAASSSSSNSKSSSKRGVTATAPGLDVYQAMTRWRAIVDEHNDQFTTYVNGSLVRECEARAMALPSFKDASPPPARKGERDGSPEKWPAAMSWRDVLPARANRSRLRLEQDVEELLRQDESLDAAAEDDRAGESGEEKMVARGLKELDERMRFLQHVRMYHPREMHLNEALGETY